MTAIAAEGIEKAYGDTVALRGVSLSIEEGEVFALVGPNGAGKTTLVRCLTGTTPPDAGGATLLGGPPAEADAERVGLLPQDFDPPDRLTARELLSYYAGLYDGARGVEGVLRDVGVADAADTRYADLSGGQKRRTLVGTAIVNDPDVLFLDEPTTGIDPAGRRDVCRLVDDLVAGGTTVLLTTHDMAEVERLADRVGVLADGELLAVDAPSALVAEHGAGEQLRVVLDGAPEPDLADYEVERIDRGVLVRDVARDDLDDVIAALDVEYEALTWRGASLETVYLALTGEEPRTVSIPGGDRA